MPSCSDKGLASKLFKAKKIKPAQTCICGCYSNMRCFLHGKMCSCYWGSWLCMAESCASLTATVCHGYSPRVCPQRSPVWPHARQPFRAVFQSVGYQKEVGIVLKYLRSVLLLDESGGVLQQWVFSRSTASILLGRVWLATRWQQ